MLSPCASALFPCGHSYVIVIIIRDVIVIIIRDDKIFAIANNYYQYLEEILSIVVTRVKKIEIETRLLPTLLYEGVSSFYEVVL